jgi:hypothetical protein
MITLKDKIKEVRIDEYMKNFDSFLRTEIYLDRPY